MRKVIPEVLFVPEGNPISHHDYLQKLQAAGLIDSHVTLAPLRQRAAWASVLKRQRRH